MKELVDRAITGLINPDTSPAYDIFDLIEEIEANGTDYVNSLRSSISIRAGLLKDDDAKQRVFKAIATIIQNIINVRGEYTK